VCELEATEKDQTEQISNVKSFPAYRVGSCQIELSTAINANKSHLLIRDAQMNTIDQKE